MIAFAVCNQQTTNANTQHAYIMQNAAQQIEPLSTKVNLTNQNHFNFWRKVNKLSGCWVWTGTKNENGYGYFGVSGKMIRAHRISWMMHNGVIPNKLHVLHKCDTPSCVNPSHLFLGTHKENMMDRDLKGRNKIHCGDSNGARIHPEKLARGSKNKSSKLSEEKILKIRLIYSLGGISQKELAAQFNMNQTTIGDIIRRETWKHVS